MRSVRSFGDFEVWRARSLYHRRPCLSNHQAPSKIGDYKNRFYWRVAHEGFIQKMAEWLAAVKEKRYAAVKGKSGPEPRPVHLSTFRWSGSLFLIKNQSKTSVLFLGNVLEGWSGTRESNSDGNREPIKLTTFPKRWSAHRQARRAKVTARWAWTQIWKPARRFTWAFPFHVSYRLVFGNSCKKKIEKPIVSWVFIFLSPLFPLVVSKGLLGGLYFWSYFLGLEISCYQILIRK